MNAEPYLIGNFSIPAQFELIAQLVSVCHQWSITGAFESFSNHLIVSGSARSPAKNKVSNWDKSYFLKNCPSGSSFLIALIAVGAVNKDFTLYSDIILQNTPASGVPTGLPSNKIVVHP